MEKIIDNKLNQEPICCIYSVTNILNNKIYIGQSIDVKRRWNQHKCGKGSLTLKNAIKKYGINNFKFEILEKIDSSNKTKNQLIELLVVLEQKWFDIKKPFFNENGYNIQKTSKPNLTTKRDKSFGEKISKILLESNHTGKPLIQYDIKGKFIKEWKSGAEVERVLGYCAENISYCCLNKSKSSHGFIWKFKEYQLTDKDIIDTNKSLRMSEVKQYNLRGELLNTFNNIKQASQLTNFRENGIRDACGKGKKTAYGFIWKFKNEPLNTLEHINKKDFQIRQINLTTKEEKLWDNVYLAIKHLNLSKYSSKIIYNVCDGKKNDYLGYKWEWVF